MSLNDKYIINGSTLSAIGDALREKNIPPKQIQGEINVYYKNYTSPWCSANGYQSFTASDFGLTSQTPVKAKMEITSKTGPDIYIMHAGSSSQVTATVGQIFYVKFPVSLRGDSSYRSSQFIAKIYPLDSNGNYIIPTSEDDTSEYSTEVTTGIIPNPNRQILVEEIASKIQTINQIALIAPFTISYSSNLAAATVLPDTIQEITDIKKLIMIESSGSSSYIRLSILEPSTASTSYYSNIGGNIQSPGTAYHMKYHDFSYSAAATANWEDTIKASSTKHDIYFNEATRQLIQLDNTSYTYNAVAGPAILIY